MRALFGTIKIQADERGRIRIPSSFREYFEDGPLYCTVVSGSNCLTIFGDDVFNNLQNQMGGQVVVGETEEYCRMRDFISNIRYIEEDKQKRFTLTQKDDVIFRVEHEMVFVGMVNRLELWRKSDYDKYKSDRTKTTGGLIMTAEGKPLTW